MSFNKLKGSYKMKKSVFILFIFGLVLVGCNSEDSLVNPVATPEIESFKQTPTNSNAKIR